MNKKTPLVSVSMIAYHAQDFIAQAIEGVLAQQVDFPIELVIGDDCSRDRTLEICKRYAEQYPDIIRILPPEPSLGAGANTARTMNNCVGKYIAVCDGDDIWTDPLKLKKQVAFLERNSDYGMVYSDVETISETGEAFDDEEHEQIRLMYTAGTVFFNLIKGNFINNSSALFRRQYLNDHIVLLDRDYQIPDHLRWLHISTRAKVHFLKEKTTAYRKQLQGSSKLVNPAIIEGNRYAFQLSLFKAIVDFDRHNTQEIGTSEQKLIFRKMLSLLYRKPGTIRMKWKILRLMPKYFPGFKSLIKISFNKITSRFPRALKNTLATN